MKSVSDFAKNHVQIFWLLAGAILLAGIFFRFWNLGTDELTFDEGIYAFRSIGYLDYMENPAQVTPIQLFADRVAPGWLSLSFHDAPPLFFAVEHAFFGLFGESLLVSRLPSAFAGLGSIVLIFFITRLLFSKFGNEKLLTLPNSPLIKGVPKSARTGDFEIPPASEFSALAAFLRGTPTFTKGRIQKWQDWAGLLSAAIMAVSSAAVAVSRLNQLEAVLFFLILLNIYFFLRLIDDKKWWWAFGVSFGLCMLTKYVAVFLLPVYFSYLFITRSPLLKDWRLYAGFGIAGIMFLPVIIYNILLYKLTGHFDLQFAYLFHQATPEWQGIGGKNQEPFSAIFRNLQIIFSIPFLTLSFFGLLFSVVSSQWSKVKGQMFPVIILIFSLVLLVAVGSAVRFISLLIIPATLFITLAIFSVGEFFSSPLNSPFRKGSTESASGGISKSSVLADSATSFRKGGIWSVIILAVLFLSYETYFTANLMFFNKADYGIVKLDNYFDAAFGGARPAGLLSHPNPNLNKIIKEYAENRPATLPALGLVYDDEISTPARLWLFSRRQYYQGIPVMPASEFLKVLRSSDGKAFKGFQIYFVKALPATTISPVNDPEYHKSFDAFWDKLPEQTKLTVNGSGGAPAFEISKLGL